MAGRRSRRSSTGFISIRSRRRRSILTRTIRRTSRIRNAFCGGCFPPLITRRSITCGSGRTRGSSIIYTEASISTPRTPCMRNSGKAHRCDREVTYVRWHFNIRAWAKSRTCVGQGASQLTNYIVIAHDYSASHRLDSGRDRGDLGFWIRSYELRITSYEFQITFLYVCRDVTPWRLRFVVVLSCVVVV